MLTLDEIVTAMSLDLIFQRHCRSPIAPIKRKYGETSRDKAEENNNELIGGASLSRFDMSHCSLQLHESLGTLSIIRHQRHLYWKSCI